MIKIPSDFLPIRELRNYKCICVAELRWLMNYPLISEYISSIMCAEDNFATLTNLRPVLDDEGQPIMSSGNFAVVFKMEDSQNHKYYALKCFTKEQNGRIDAYKCISMELADIHTNYITNFKFIENELYVDSANKNAMEVPVVLMDWVDGVAFDIFIENNIKDSHKLLYLAYKFQEFISWLLSQPFAHGDIKPDNLLVKDDCSLVLIDYDGVYVPSMKNNYANEIGSPNYQHPARNTLNFGEHIDDFSLNVLLIELLNAIYQKVDVTFPLFDVSDFNNPYISKTIKALYPSNSITLNKAVNILVDSLVSNSIIIDFSHFDLICASIRTNYYLASNEIVKELFESKKYHPYDTRGYIRKEENYPIGLYNYDCNRCSSYPCGIKDGCLLYVQDYDRGWNLLCDEIWEDYWSDIAIPDEIVSVADGAFMDCYYVKTIIFPNTVKHIGEKVFHGCPNLSFVILPNELESVGKDLFALTYDDFPGRRYGHMTLNDMRLLQMWVNRKHILVPEGRKEYYYTILPQYRHLILDISEYLIESRLGKDRTKLFEWYKRFAEQGDARAQYELGRCYVNGDGVEQNLTKALEWCKKSAEQGYVYAQYDLGFYYYIGYGGIDKNIAKADEWYKKSTKQLNVTYYNDVLIRWNKVDSE